FSTPFIRTAGMSALLVFVTDMPALLFTFLFARDEEVRQRSADPLLVQFVELAIFLVGHEEGIDVFHQFGLALASCDALALLAQRELGVEAASSNGVDLRDDDVRRAHEWNLTRQQRLDG